MRTFAQKPSEVQGRTSSRVARARLIKPQGARAAKSAADELSRHLGAIRLGQTDAKEEAEANQLADRAMGSDLSPAPHTRLSGRGTMQFELATRGVLSGAGAPLPGGVRSFMESRFRHNFGNVRIHTGSATARSAHAMSTRAFTIGNHVAFGHAQFAPHTARGRHLIAHELAHVVQNSRSLGPEAGPVIRRAPPDSEKREGEQEPKWEDDYYYNTEEEAQRRVQKLKETWTKVRYIEIKIKGETKWRVEKLGPREQPAKEGPTADTARKLGKSGWTPDAKRFETHKAAEPRKKALQVEDEWEKYLITQVEEGQKTFYRVEMRNKLTPGTSEFALTFDDGPHSAALGKGTNRTEKVLDTLAAKGIKGKGAFFVQTHAPSRGSTTVGKKLIARMFAEGYAVGIHTGGKVDHEAHPKAQKAGRLEGELESAKTHLAGIGGSDPELVRAPYGMTDAEVRKVYAKLKLKHLHWDIDGDPGGSHAIRKLQSFFDYGLVALRRGSKGTFHPKTGVSSRIVVLYHDIRKGTADNIGAMIHYIKKRVPKAKFEKP